MPKRRGAPTVVVPRSAWGRVFAFLAQECEHGTFDCGSIDLNPNGQGRFTILLTDGSSPQIPGVFEEKDEQDTYGEDTPRPTKDEE